MTQAVARRTIYLPDNLEDLIREHSREGESLSATIGRLIESGALESARDSWPDWIGSGEGPSDLGINAEKYLGLKPWEPGDKGPG